MMDDLKVQVKADPKVIQKEALRSGQMATQKADLKVL